MSTIFDVAVMGGGPGGYVAALRAAQNGLSVVCIDDGVNAQGEPSPGGTCLNVGCIPSKSLLQSSELYAQVQHEASIHGVNVDGVSFNAAAMIQRKDAIVSRLTMGIGLLFKKNKVKYLCGLATLEHAQDEIWQLRVNDQQIRARNVVIATGSQPRQLPGVTIDNQQILDNRGALALTAVPPRLGVIGAGVIGLELGSVWNRVGSDVTLLEMAPTFLPALEARLSNEVRKAMIASGMKMQLAVEIEAIEQRDDGVHVRWRQGEKREESRFDKLIFLPLDVYRDFLVSISCNSVLKPITVAVLPSITYAVPGKPGCGQLVMSCEGRCWRIKRWLKVWWLLIKLPDWR